MTKLGISNYHLRKIRCTIPIAIKNRDLENFNCDNLGCVHADVV